MNINKIALILKNRAWVSLVIGIIIFMWLGFLLTPQRPTPFPNYIVSSPSPTGVKAFYSLLKNRIEKVDIWKKSVYELPKSSNQLMIMIQPYSEFTSNETEALIKWMEEGNKIWLIAEYPNIFFTLDSSTSNSEIDTLQTIYGDLEFKGSTYQAEVYTNQRLLPKPGDEALLWDGNGVLALSRVYGKGQLNVLLTPNWLINDQILEYEHIELVLPFILKADPEVIWFNEFIHGDKTLPVILEIYPDWFLLLFTQSGLILLLWLWYKGKRFGPIVTPREWVVRFGDERIKAIAAWNLRGRFYKDSLEVQENYLRHTVQEKWKVSATLSNLEWIIAVKRRLPLEIQKQWEQYWKELQILLQDKKITQKVYMKWSKRLNSMRKDVEN